MDRWMNDGACEVGGLDGKYGIKIYLGAGEGAVIVTYFFWPSRIAAPIKCELLVK